MQLLGIEPSLSGIMSSELPQSAKVASYYIITELEVEIFNVFYLTIGYNNSFISTTLE